MASASTDSTSVVDHEVKDLLTCTLCSRYLNDPRSLTCLHHFCKGCLGKYVKRLRGGDKNIEIFPCPTCHSEFTLKPDQDVAEVQTNQFLKNILEIMEIQQKAKASTACSRCHNPAINLCVSCEIRMCKKCSEAHDNWFTKKNHEVLSIQELSMPEGQAKVKSKPYCKQHKENVLEVYCETCKELCCIHCMLLSHQRPDHSCVAVSEIAKSQRETLQSNCATLVEKLSEGKVALKNIAQVMKSLGDNAKTAKEQIREHKKSILKVVAEKLDEREKKMNEEVDKIYDELCNELCEQNDEIKGYLRKVQVSISFPKKLLKEGSIEEILSARKLIDENIEKLQKEQPYDLTPANDGDIQYVPGDISQVSADGIVDKFGQVKDDALIPANLKTSSSILEGKVAFMRRLHKWVGDKCKWNLCYRASRDGWSAQTFHSRCDNKGRTVVLVKANNCIFGGYTDQSWSTGGNWRNSSSSFLFSLQNKDNLALGPFIANIKQGQQQHAICCSSSYGPNFGSGPDLRICGSPNVNQSSSNFGNTYQLPPGYDCGSEQAYKLLAGQKSFITTEIEVFN
ncbi:E3 ubiquitin-protein ligase TRIM33-like [Dendronephthya gigantea]|uniref:E3 ubiquitin-protein ligase TRIM33-like n=1 Tax=Dendronephthya gigantea TaxID=151771 RepID=UPI00106B4D21|nr:E3 ubiquitin-protein ligase TRIM33-like [Dendronephthya gigantea]